MDWKIIAPSLSLSLALTYTQAHIYVSGLDDLHLLHARIHLLTQPSEQQQSYHSSVHSTPYPQVFT